MKKSVSPNFKSLSKKYINPFGNLLPSSSLVYAQPMKSSFDSFFTFCFSTTTGNQQDLLGFSQNINKRSSLSGLINRFKPVLSALLIIAVISSCGGKKDTPEKVMVTIEKKEVPEFSIPTKKSVTLQFTNTVEFIKPDGKSILVDVAVASTEEQRNQGLMNVESLAKNQGMLFLFEQEKPLSFWMANTPLSLDIIFVSENFEIVRIHSNTEPFTTKQYASTKPARYVVEVVGGFCIANDIIEGSLVGFNL